MGTHSTKREKLDELADEIEEPILVADGFDEAIIGLSSKNIVVYDREKCINILARNMSYEEAVEYFDFNVEGAYMGEKTPIFVNTLY